MANVTFEDTVTTSQKQMNFVIQGMRNPMNSWEKSDTAKESDSDKIVIGKNDLFLMKRLIKAGTDHRKFMRMLPVYVRIKGPLYWIAELDTYKIGTVRNSCSFMHKGTSKEFTIQDFAVEDERIYEILTVPDKKEYVAKIPYETDDFKLYTDPFNGRNYRVYRNGKVIREAFDYIDSMGRHRHYEEAPAKEFHTASGYEGIVFSGRGNRHILLHRLVASVWIPNPQNLPQVNHIDGDKGNNCVENLEWVTAKENMKHAVEHGLYDFNYSFRKKYLIWKANRRIFKTDNERDSFFWDVKIGMRTEDLIAKYKITSEQVNGLKYYINNPNNEDLFNECLMYEKMLERLNNIRADYLETKDDSYFRTIRQILPSGYLQTSNYMFNYEVLRNIYFSRKNHRLPEWQKFCSWVETLPYSDLITKDFNETN